VTPWLAIVGIGEDGLGGLSPTARGVLDSAEVLIGGERHLAMVPTDARERHAWPKPLSALVDRIVAMRGRNVCVLSTGDPMQFGIGATLSLHVPAEEMTIVPSLSAFALAASRLVWPLEQTICLSLHGRPVEGLALHLAPAARLLMLTSDAGTPEKVAAMLCQRGFDGSRMVALAHMGGQKEARIESIARDWHGKVPDFHTLAVECVAGPEALWYPRTGLPDDTFEHDGQLTKREFRTLALAKLMPHSGALLWDVGSGCGSIAIEWMRAADHARAIGIEPNDNRRALAARNAAALGVPALELVDGRAPQALDTLPPPDAVFIGGGISQETISAAINSLRPGGRLVAHAVTLRSEALLLAAHAENAGEMVRLAVARAEPLGEFSAWHAARPVTQWAWRKS
jgi:precorrin-6B C5,15-methyltransferase / cobalt-precorrin-6B C5,C15-methyltransferase